MTTVRDELAGHTRYETALGARLEQQLSQLLNVNAETLAYVAIFVVAIATRFWDLGMRVMSHDESLHTHFSYQLYIGNGYAHTPMMHGPLLFHATALMYLLFGASDFTSRIYPAVVGVVVVMMPLFMRKWLGKLGALAASVMLLISPLILYYSRYIRHDLPAILAALAMAVAIWRYVETRQFKYLIWLALGDVILVASKEVSFIYVAIFGSFVTLLFISRLLEAEWKKRALRTLFIVALAGVLICMLALGAVKIVVGSAQAGAALTGAETITPLNPETGMSGLSTAGGMPMSLPSLILSGLLGVFGVLMVGSVLAGQWGNLRRFPEVDVAMTLGTLILPMLTPFLITFAGFNPMDETTAGIARSLAFTLPVMLVSVVLGLAYFMKPPKPHRVAAPAVLTDGERDGLSSSADPLTGTVEVPPDAVDWITAFFTSRWWALGGLYWLIYIFFFTTMFTNGAGLGTGIIGSLGYWLEQQGVKRGNQPWYYYIMVLVPMYEFLPLILSVAAGFIGLRKWGQSIYRTLSGTDSVSDENEDVLLDGSAVAEPAREPLDLDAPIQFPVLLFLGYWIVTNFIAYSLAGEKMPWLTTHLTTPMILLGGWAVGLLLGRIDWKRLFSSRTWLLLPLVPLLVISLLRMVGPLCTRAPNFLLCNTIIPPRYITSVFQGSTVDALSATGGWLAAVIVTVAVIIALVALVERGGVRLLGQVAALMVVGWLAFLTARSAWLASYINYDDATEFLVYAHSSGAVKQVLNQIQEISLKTTDGYDLKVAYDNQVSWPMTWYLRDYPNAVYYGTDPSRGTIGDAPVILAGPTNWAKVEALLGDRYYKFEYIRMWWPMQDYFGYEQPSAMISMLGTVLSDGQLQRGIWDIFFNRNYNAYADAVAKYRNGNRPNFDLSQWPVSERMRFYVRKDVFAQVWDYGVAASDIAQATDPYAKNALTLAPDETFGGGQLNRPHAIAMNSEGQVVVADSQNHRIAVFSPAGQLISTLGSYGLAPQTGVFNEPWGVAVAPDGTIYVADTWNHRIEAFSPDGQFKFTWGAEGPNDTTNTSAFWGPRAVAVDANGNVYVADTGNKRIMVYNSQGVFLRQIGSGGTLDGQLDEPVGLTIGPNDGLLYVADTWNQRIDVFTTDGQFVRNWPVEAWFAQSNERPYLGVDSSGNVYVTDPDASRVIVFDSTGQYLYSFGDYSTIGTAGAVVADNMGHLYVVDTGNGDVQRYTLPGSTGPGQ